MWFIHLSKKTKKKILAMNHYIKENSYYANKFAKRKIILSNLIFIN